MPITKDDIKRFLNKDWNTTWDSVLDDVINGVVAYFQEWFGWKWEQTITGEKVHFKNYVGVVSNPVKTLTAIKDKAGNALDLSTFVASGFLIYDEDFRFKNDELYVDYVSVDIPPPVKAELIIVIASVFDRIYQGTYDKDTRVMDGGGFRINERYRDVFDDAQKRLKIYQKMFL